MENAIMRKLLRESLEEKRIGYKVWMTDRQEDLVRIEERKDSESWLASSNLKANLSGLVLGCIEADLQKTLSIIFWL